ncbi:hypothetical protein ACIA8K_39610 [Catenuloplanes sp. NPDC051500]
MDTPRRSAATPALAAILRRVQARVANERREQTSHPAHTASLAART